MKRFIWISAAVITVALVYSFLTVRAEDSATGEYMIIRYSPQYFNKQIVTVSTPDKEEELTPTKEEALRMSKYISKLMTRYSAEGYDLVSTTLDSSGNINCFLMRTK